MPAVQPNCPPDAQPVTVQVVDACPNCTSNQISLNYLTFSQRCVPRIEPCMQDC